MVLIGPEGVIENMTYFMLTLSKVFQSIVQWETLYCAFWIDNIFIIYIIDKYYSLVVKTEFCPEDTEHHTKPLTWSGALCSVGVAYCVCEKWS